ncbi:pentatricopeptide repeat-containing protein At1g32415, mitochondrial [Elaeis guineensis]|uniref:Pentatricopeptide repeat-containing protein At1g32415, mitochondrial n=1 Tax=Elaeis guineensis var. tenera TaxID=51953 RepID=A0A6I9S7W8_ELAGV|nr:pentatricopeptide repeat-containing protein At1g32415, mitochondrial [Elaeis guineensis]
MPSSRLFSFPLLLPSRSLHATPAFRTHLPCLHSNNAQDPELHLLRCLCRRDLAEAHRLLDETPSVVRWTAALSRFARDGFLDEARTLFDLMPRRNLVTWNALISAYARVGHHPAALDLFRRMPARNVLSYTSLLSALTRAGRTHEALSLFHSMPDRNAISYNAMIAGLVRNGNLEVAQRLFDEMPHRTAASWNALLAGYAERGRMAEARGLFVAMGASADVVSWTTMIAGYARAGDVREAYDLFRTMIPARNVVSWTAMIGGFAWNGHHEEALLLFLDMNRTAAVKPNGETIVSLIFACAGLGYPRVGKQVHAHAVAHGMDGDDGRISKGLIRMYSRFGTMDWAHRIFNQNIRRGDAVCWNSMIEGYIKIGRLEEARRLFDAITVDPEGFTWVTMVVTWTTMVAAYFDAGDVAEARRLFDLMPERDATAWTAVISGLVQNEMIPEAFEAFGEMRSTGCAPVDHALASLLGAVGSVAHLEIGEQMHGLVTKTRPDCGPGSDTVLCNALVAMYAKSGDVEAARRVFHGMVTRDVVTWNGIIMGMAHHGRAHEALQMFDAMQREGVGLDRVTGLGVLTACGHAGLVDRGMEVFRFMVDRVGWAVGPEHYASVVDMLGRAGRFEEAERFAREMPVELGMEVWGTLLGTCGMKWVRGVGERAARRVLEMDPMNGAAHVALCHVYAGRGEYTEEWEVRKEMGRKGVRKRAGCSWIGVRGIAHVFLCGDRSHPRTDEIYALLTGDNWKG